MQVKLDEPGTVYFVVVANGDAAPSSSQVKQGQNSGGAAALCSGTIAVTAANTQFTGAANSGLAASTPYDVYVAAQARSCCAHVG